MECLTKSSTDTVIVLNSNKVKKIKKNNDTYKSLADYIGYMNVVYYDPTDFSIFQGSPLLRRRFFDILFCQISKDYLNASSEYKRLLKERKGVVLAIGTFLCAMSNYFLFVNFVVFAIESADRNLARSFLQWINVPPTWWPNLIKFTAGTPLSANGIESEE